MTDAQQAYADAYNTITLTLMVSGGCPESAAVAREYGAAVQHRWLLWASLSMAERVLLLRPDTSADPIDPPTAMQARTRSRLH